MGVKEEGVTTTKQGVISFTKCLSGAQLLNDPSRLFILFLFLLKLFMVCVSLLDFKDILACISF